MSKKNTAKKIAEEIIEEAVDTARIDLEAVRLAALNSVKEMPTKSAKIRALSAAGHPTGEISKILGIRYQHVRNVLTTPLKRPLAKKQKEETVAAAQ